MKPPPPPRRRAGAGPSVPCARPVTGGLAACGALLLAENLVAVYFYLSTRMLYSGDPVAQKTVVVLRTLELLAVGFLTYVTMQ